MVALVKYMANHRNLSHSVLPVVCCHNVLHLKMCFPKECHDKHPNINSKAECHRCMYSMLTSDMAVTNRLSRGPSTGPLPGRAPHRFHSLCLPHPSHPKCGTLSVVLVRRRQLVHSKKRRVAFAPVCSWPSSLQRLLKKVRRVLHCVSLAGIVGGGVGGDGSDGKVMVGFV